MWTDDELRIRPGRVRAGGPRVEPFLNKALRAAQKAGGLRAETLKASRFGRGRSATLAASRRLGDRSRGAVIKARVVRRMSTPGALAAHLRYLGRDGTTRDGEAGRLFDAQVDTADPRAFADRCDGDRHHFRFIVSPDDATELAHLKTFTRELMTQAERDLGTKLDWVAVDHWNTEHPHIHVLVRGRTDTGEDLVISRDYISRGLRARAAGLVTLELGPRTELEILRSLDAQIDADRWTKLDRALASQARDGIVDLRPDPFAVPDPLRETKIGRMRKLERLGLAEPAGSVRWRLDPDTESRLRALGERDDIIKRLHRSFGDNRSSILVLDGERQPTGVLGRLVARGLDDELRGSAFAIVEGIDGKAHHLRLDSLEATGDGAVNSIVELRRFSDVKGQERVALAVRSDLSLERQMSADGATWLDRQLVARAPPPLADGGFGSDVREALGNRSEYLVKQGLGTRDSTGQFSPVQNLLDRLRDREIAATGQRLAAETGLTPHPHVPGELAAGLPVSGTYRQRLTLASGRFAMIDDGLGFQLVPWSPGLERHLGQAVSGVTMPGGGIDWTMGRKRDLGI